ncbi:hypothetical protein HMF8227_02936 [Saliniradius amylolyticus]|uniref:HTH tetR-type domain-containing protein n=1 Tax=Saliniradius amylolyticus TaxID=2183582 RepID=A0A2S2E6V0_9ALTE|nr:TetR/AcrR family transcriptional regulator [Saliniradius amylolyticus]AWL13384.1 hypothetical protein HMF8227_02936 [Saliniradius amylolyticus]
MGRSDDKQNDILCAAISEFSEKGMMATTMEAIAQRGHVSKRTLYKHYPCKVDLMDAVVDLLMQRIEPLKDVSFAPERPFLEQVQELAQLAVDLFTDEDYLRLARIVILESVRSEREAGRLNEKFASCEAGMNDWFKQAEQAGALGHFNAETASELFYGTIKKLAFWDRAVRWKPPMNKQETQQKLENFCQFFCAGLGREVSLSD